MVNVTHDADDRRTLDQILGAILTVVEKSVLDGGHDLARDLCPQFIGYKSGGVKIDHLIDCRHNSHHHKALYHLGSRYLKT